MFAILGPTASGKSALAMRLAEAHQGEIVSCDAVMVYRGFDVAANKPDANDRARVPHHMLDVREWSRPMNAAEWADEASRRVAEIAERGRTPIVVVGTFLYYRALQYGLGALPPASPEIRAELLAKGPGWIAQEVSRLDPESFAEANGKNTHRLLRALEVFRLTGRKASELKKEHGFAHARYVLTKIGLLPPRSALDARVQRRTEEMLSRGALEEVKRLRAQGVPADARPMCAVGYRQLNEVIDRGGDPTEAIATATRQYARRQMSFFKHEPGVRWEETFGEEVRI